MICLFPFARRSYAAEGPAVRVSIQGQTRALKMGNTPTFTGTVTNVGDHTLQHLVVYLSLVSLKPGHELPMDLEDWSAQKAIRIDKLSSGESHSQGWRMRLIQAGKFGIALTVVDPKENRPNVSDLLTFTIQPKPMLNSSRIIPVAWGEPVLLLAALALAHWTRIRSRRPGKPIHE
jgi:hypothetical protein